MNGRYQLQNTANEYPQTVLEQSGAIYAYVGTDDPHAIRGCKLVTSQNQQSASEYALGFLHALTGSSPVNGS